MSDGYVFDSYIDINVPDGCILFDPNINQILPDENNIYKLYKPLYRDSGKSAPNYDYYYMGFPKSMYTGQTIYLTSNWCGKFCDSDAYRGDPNKELETIVNEPDNFYWFIDINGKNDHKNLWGGSTQVDRRLKNLYNELNMLLK